MLINMHFNGGGYLKCHTYNLLKLTRVVPDQTQDLSFLTNLFLQCICLRKCPIFEMRLPL